MRLPSASPSPAQHRRRDGVPQTIIVRLTILLPMVILAVAMMNISMASYFNNHHQIDNFASSKVFSVASSGDVTVEQQQQQQQQKDQPHDSAVNHMTTNRTSSCSSLCCRFQRTILNGTTDHFATSSPASIWKRFFLSTSYHFEENDLGWDASLEARRRYRQWLDQLMAVLTPHRLQQAWKASPSANTIRAIHHIVEQRIEHPETAPPLRIAVLGGSVTAGHDVERNNVGLHMHPPKPTKGNAWSQRLEHWMNTVMSSMMMGEEGQKIVEIWNMAVSGSTSDIGSMILQYHLFPPEWNGASPDVIVWSFATNDLRTTRMGGSSFRISQLQHFITQAQELRCNINGSGTTLPLLLLLDDLVLHPGPVQKSQSYSDEIAWLAQWNEALGLSVGSAFLDVALANPQESSFHAEWVAADNAHPTTGDDGKDHSVDDTDVDVEFRGRGPVVAGWKQPGRIHPGWGVHVAISAIVMYHFVKEATEFCQAQLSGDDWIQNNPILERSFLSTKKHHPVPSVPLPPYNLTIDSRNILPLWKDKEIKYHQDCAARQHGEGRLRCSYAWVSNRLARMGTKAQVKDWINQILVRENPPPIHWLVNGIAAAGSESDDKVGWEATAPNASFAIEHTNRLELRPIQKITVICMHSYGEKWKDARLQIIIARKTTTTTTGAADYGKSQTILTTEDVVGFHGSRTSVYHPYVFQLNDDQAILPGDRLRMEFRLIGGTTFKILGLTFCAD